MALMNVPWGAAGSPPGLLVRDPTRKVGLLGSHTPSLQDCPWDDPSWELWGHASSHGFYKRKLDRYFDMHRPERWTRGGKKGAQYPEWLRMNTVPIYMQKRYPAPAPASVKYPKNQILQEFGVADNRTYFPNSIGWMMALALTEGVKTIGLWGINYASKSEWGIQRGGAEYWLGYAAGKGVKLILPERCTLLREPAGLYGYESHNEQGFLTEEYEEKRFKSSETIRPLDPQEKIIRSKPPEHLLEEIKREEEMNPRPDWAVYPDMELSPAKGNGASKPQQA